MSETRGNLSPNGSPSPQPQPTPINWYYRQIINSYTFCQIWSKSKSWDIQLNIIKRTNVTCTVVIWSELRVLTIWQKFDYNWIINNWDIRYFKIDYNCYWVKYWQMPGISVAQWSGDGASGKLHGYFLCVWRKFHKYASRKSCSVILLLHWCHCSYQSQRRAWLSPN